MPSSFSIRRASAADAAAVRALARAAYAKWIPVVGREPLPMRADYERAVVEHLVDLMEEDGRLLALIETIVEPDHLLIENVAVDPAHQGRGLGEALLRHADDVARGLGLAEVRLYTNAAFASNVAFYARRGFEETGRTQAPATGTTVHMRKRLDAG